MKANPGVMMRKKLLLAEDSVTIQKVFELAFAQSDVTVVAVDNGDDAVRMAVEIAPDLVIADVTLPGMDGYDVASAILQGEFTRDLPVLILSGTLVPFDDERFRACGAHGVLFKPFETRELLEKVESLIGKREEAPAVAIPPPPPPPVDEHWDFSDVLDEVEEAKPAASPEEAAKPREEAFSGEILNVRDRDPGASYDEFDVSIEEIEEPSAPPAEMVPPAAAEPPSEVEALEEIQDIQEIEEIEEIEEIPEMPEFSESAEPPANTEIPETPETPKVPETLESPETPERPEIPGDDVVLVFDEPLVPIAPASAVFQDEVLQAELKEQFVARAEVVFRNVASDAIEKVMWEMMERLTEEFSAKIRESVEAVAWEVIPATAEALIREEISRIRNQAGKPMSS